jgi:hypothetical protein
MNNPKIIALAQTLFYGFFTIATPLFIQSLGQGGAFYGMLSPTLTGILLFSLNYLDNYLNSLKGGTTAMFGVIKV